MWKWSPSLTEQIIRIAFHFLFGELWLNFTTTKYWKGISTDTTFSFSFVSFLIKKLTLDKDKRTKKNEIHIILFFSLWKIESMCYMTRYWSDIKTGNSFFGSAFDFTNPGFLSCLTVTVYLYPLTFLLFPPISFHSNQRRLIER